MHTLRYILGRYLYFLLYIVVITACNSSHKEDVTEEHQPTSTAQTYDLDDLLEVGELIAVTISGPNSYYEYQGQPMGLQYQLAQLFAQSQGVRLRMEVVKDTTALFQYLRSGEADLIAYELPTETITKTGFTPCASDSVTSTYSTFQKQTTGWAIRNQAIKLKSAIDAWYKPTRKKKLKENTVEAQTRINIPAKRNVRAPYISLQQGIISPYDAEFMRHGQRIGWDWKLLAAQCYQESAFDPKAVSWAGARGLMQIMPGTADLLHLPFDQIHHPGKNIEAAANYLKQLEKKFSDIPNRIDRICFVLAAYNGGYHHIRDAMKLASKYKKNTGSWKDVSFYVKALSTPTYYNDPIVKYGYMIGTETYNYVFSIMERWDIYRKGSGKNGNVGNVFQPNRATKRNRFNTKQEILKPDEIEKLIQAKENTKEPINE